LPRRENRGPADGNRNRHERGSVLDFRVSSGICSLSASGSSCARAAPPLTLARRRLIPRPMADAIPSPNDSSLRNHPRRSSFSAPVGQRPLPVDGPLLKVARIGSPAPQFLRQLERAKHAPRFQPLPTLPTRVQAKLLHRHSLSFPLLSTCPHKLPDPVRNRNEFLTVCLH